MYTISEDFEPSVRSELMEQFPHIAAFCKEHPATLGNVMQKYLIPIMLNYLGMENNQVRRTCYAALLTLVKRRLINLQSLHDRICPLIIHTTEKNQSEEHRTEAILFICKLAVQLGKQATEKLFLSRFFTLCSDESFHVRKACADSFGDMFGSVGKAAREEKLLPKFFSLCKDPVWGVRKACAEVFMPISCICSMDTRHKELANVFISLLCDQSRWVRMASFQTLGPFISTFAKPDKTGLYYTKDGVLTTLDVPHPNLEEPDSLLEESQFEDFDHVVPSSNDDTETSTCYSSSLDRTTSGNSCDNVVPLCNAPENQLTACTNVVSCHSGNFCTVIEVSATSNNATSVADCDTTEQCIPLENGIDDDASDALDDLESSESLVCKEKTTDLDYKYINCNDNSRDEDSDGSKAFKKLWYETMFGESEMLTNGDISSEIYEDEDDDEDQDDDGNSDSLIIKNCLNRQSLDRSLTVSKESESEILSTVTVNGVSISNSVALDGPLNCVDLPAVSCSSGMVEEDSKNDIEACNMDNSFKDSELAWLEPDVGADDSEHSTDEQIGAEMLVQRIDTFLKPIEENEIHAVDELTLVEELGTIHQVAADDESAFNHFQYWRTPLPEIDISIVQENKCVTCFPVKKRWRDDDVFNSNGNETFSILNYNSASESCFPGCGTAMNGECIKSGKDPCLSQLDKEGEPPPKSFTRQLYSVNDQDIVPPQLLLRYLSMTDVSRAQTVDTDIARHCAYSLPAVALTLGRKFWPCLRETYNTLASDMQGFIMQWKVRRTLASSMHQIAVILGPDITARDLVPIFSGFIKDLDEVRIGILQHVAEFLKVLRVEERRLFLPQLSEFLNTDNERNWRFRLILAEQMIPIAELYNPEDVRDHLVPLSLALVWDKVSEVRMAAVRVMAVLIRRMSQSPSQALTKCVLTDLAEKFIHAPKWLHRQIYVYLCQEFVREGALPADQFAEEAMPHLLYLCWDRVPNVRIAIARCLAAVIWPLETFSNPESPHRELLLQTIHTLQSDVDADVRYYANMVSTHECTCLQHAELNDLASESFI